MIKRTLLLLAVAVVFATTIPGRAVADRCATGRITALTATSISVYDRETITFSVDSRTRYTKWITRGRWQEQTQISPEVLDIGQLIAIHPRADSGNLARWVQIATDVH